LYDNVISVRFRRFSIVRNSAPDNNNSILQRMCIRLFYNLFSNDGILVNHIKVNEIDKEKNNEKL